MKIKNFKTLIFLTLVILIILFGGTNKSYAVTMSSTTISYTKEYYYTGKAIKPTVTIKYKGKSLKQNKDYRISYSNNKEIGTGKITIVGLTKQYNGSVTKTFKIKGKIEKAKITVRDVVYSNSGGDKQYTGVKVISQNNKTLREGTDYKLSYTNNTKVGTAKVTIKGIGNYTGSVTKSFKITKASLKNVVSRAYVSSTGTIYYKAEKLTPPVKFNTSQNLVQGRDYTLSYSNNINAGTATVKITGIGNYTGTITTTFKINKATINGFSYAGGNYTYTGKPIKLSRLNVYLVLGNNKKVQLKENKDYKVTYSNNTKPGTAKITIQGIGNCQGTKVLTFKIVKK